MAWSLASSGEPGSRLAIPAEGGSLAGRTGDDRARCSARPGHALALLLAAAAVACSGETGASQDSTAAEEVVGSDDSGSPADIEPADNIGPDSAIDTEDAGIQCPGGAGCACEGPQDCDNGLCIDTPEGGICTEICVNKCDNDLQTCAAVPQPGGDIQLMCTLRFGLLCEPCVSKADCPLLGSVDTEAGCFRQTGAGGELLAMSCSVVCKEDQDCLAGYGCRDALTAEGDARKACLPLKDGQPTLCPCSPRAVKKSLSSACQTKAEGHVCAGTRTCTTVGEVGACSAKPAGSESCDGIDNDCDGTTDEGLCDDQDPCTSDLCDAKTQKCSHTQNQGACDDGNACTGTDQCSAGTCNGVLLDCEDKNPCTTDSCDIKTGCVQKPHTKPCDDGSACTNNDLCDGKGACVGLALDVSKTCNDDNPCTAEGCDKATGCNHKPAAGVCEDGNPCTNGDSCAAGSCTSGQNECACQTNDDCKASDDDNLCNGKLYCDKAKAPFVCKVDPKTIVTCDTTADTTCLATACTPKSGSCDKVTAADAKPCDADGSVCSVNDACQGGACKAGSALNCEDNNPCTDDTCDAKAGCKAVNTIGACDDGEACTKGDTCASGKCVPGVKLVCNDDNECTVDVCDKLLGKCVYDGKPAEGDPCDADKSVCTKGDTCQAGACKAGKALVCNDDDGCTTDSCDAQTGCKYLDNTDACDADGNPCSVGDACKNGTCQKGPPKDCDGLNPCTLDGCDKATGKCTHDGKAQDLVPCDADGSVCTEGDNCQAGKCTLGKTKDCDDSNGCTTDSCHAKGGCQNVSNDGKICDDGDACTKSDTCITSKCAGLKLNCNDNNPCTDDVCAADDGCKYPAIADGKSCGSALHCVAGKCVTPKCGDAYTAAGEQCDDGNALACDGCESCQLRGQLALAGKGAASFAAPTPNADGATSVAALLGDLTIELWVRPDALGVAGGNKEQLLVSRAHGQSVVSPYQVGISAAGVPFFRHTTTAGSESVQAQKLKAPWVLTQGKWVHLAVTVAGSEVRLFVDGAPAGGGPLQQARVEAPAATLTVGARTPGEFAAGFIGRIDALHIAAGALHGGVFVPGRESRLDPTTVGVWRFDAAKGATKVADGSVLGHDLVLAGDAAVASDDCQGGDPKASVCGDGIVSPHEECDNTDALACDGCEACRSEKSLKLGIKGVLVTPGLPTWAPDALCPGCRMTVEAWVRPDNTNGVFEVAALSCGFGSLILAQNPSGGTHFGFVRFPLPPLFGTTVIKPGKWYHVAATLGWNAGDPIRVWVDGKLEGEVTAGAAAALPGYTIDKELLFIGAGVGGTGGGCVADGKTPAPGSSFPGAIDEFRVSAGLRYSDAFTPRRRLLPDAATRGLWHFDSPGGVGSDDSGRAVPTSNADVTAPLDACYGDTAGSAVCGDGQQARWEPCDNGSANGPWPGKCDKACGQTSEPDCTSLGWQTGTVPTGKNTLTYDVTGWTLEGWVRLAGLPSSGYGVIAGVDEPGGSVGCPSMPANQSWRVAVGPGGLDVSRLGGTGEKVGTAPPVWQVGVWQHFALQHEQNGQGSLFVDGRKVRSFLGASTAWSASCPLRLGDASQQGNHPQAAELASLRLSKGARYGQGFGLRRTLDPDKRTVFLFEFGEGTGTSAIDLVTGFKLDVLSPQWTKAKGPGCKP